jgi:hypothetical protein
MRTSFTFTILYGCRENTRSNLHANSNTVKCGLTCGDVAQLGEHLTGSQAVVSSSLIISTFYFAPQ